MAEKTVISIEVDGVQKSINSVKELKQAISATQEQMLKGNKDAANSYNTLKSKLNELNSAANSATSSGIENLTGSFSTLKEGIMNFDTGKIQNSLKGMASAMKAIPIFLIIEGIKYLVDNFDELSKGSGVLATILRSVSDAISWLVDGFTDLIGVTSDSTRALEEQGKAIATNAQKSNEALQSQTAAFDRQIAVAKVSGKSTVELEKQKQQAIIDTNYLIAKQIEAFVRAGGELDAEKSKQLTASLEFIKNAKVQEYVITETDNKAKQEQYKKHLEAKKAADDKAKSELERSKAESDALFESLSKEQDAKLAAANKEKDDLEAQRAKLRDEMKTQQLAADKQAVADFIANEAAKAQAEKDRINSGFALAQQSLQASQALSDIFFNQKLSKAQKGSAEETAIAKKQFEVNKGLQIANATMQGAQAVLAAYASGSAIPIIGAVAGPLYAVAAGLVAIKNIQQIKATQFGGGAPSISAGATTAPNIPTSNGTPSIAPPPQNTTTFTGNNNNNFNQPIKVYLPETDIKNATNSADKIKAQATF
jgi:hypothetical protein